MEKKFNHKLVGSPGSAHNHKYDNEFFNGDENNNKYYSLYNDEKAIKKSCKFFGFSSVEDVLKNPKDFESKYRKMMFKNHPDKNINN